MRYIYNDSLDAAFNLAAEEYAFNSMPAPVFMLWRNDNAIIVGKNQNTLQEINADYVKEHGITVIRLLSGGGAVYHDLGNLNFTFIFPDDGRDMAENFSRFTQPLVEVLALLGIKAGLSGRNDVEIDGRKISGNAQYISEGKVLHHGTILINSDMGAIAGALNVNNRKIQSKGVKSVSGRVVNVSEYVRVTAMEFKERFEEYICSAYDDIERYEFTQVDVDAINTLVVKKYGTWEWNYGYSPKYDYTHSERFDGGSVEVNLNVKSGVIEKVRIYGDYFSRRDVSDIENALIGIRHDREAVKLALAGFDVGNYFSGISMEQIAGMF